MFRRARRHAPEDTEQPTPEPYNDTSEEVAEEVDAPLPTADDGFEPEPPSFLKPQAEDDAEDEDSPDDGATQAFTRPAAAPRETFPQSVPQFNMMTARIPERTLDNATTIGPEATIEGTLRSSGNLRVLGSVSGTLDVGGVLVIERGGRVDAQIEAGSVRVHGQLEGNVRCHDRLDVGEGSRIEGSFSTPTLLIEDGAEVRGTFVMRAGAGQPALFGVEEAKSR